ncbi:MAG: hypothetical protein IJT38_05600 [Clostridia bacterium]|nr:hypothetical protein [Clostridia bacterium]
MAFSVYYYNDEPNAPHRTFLCDARTDIDSLPTQTVTTDMFRNGTPTGSTALVAEDASVWILNNAGVWTEL